MMTLEQRIIAVARILWRIDAPEDPDGYVDAYAREKRDYTHNAEVILRAAIPEFFTNPPSRFWKPKPGRDDYRETDK